MEASYKTGAESNQSNGTSIVDWLEILVSMVPKANALSPSHVAVSEVLRDIREGKWREPVEHIRAEYERAAAERRDPKEAVAELKKALPGVMWSGQFKTRKKEMPLGQKLLRHSGLLCADLDHLDERTEEVRAKLISSPHPLAVFLSPTGTGLKSLFPVQADAATHKASFQAIEKYVRDLTGYEIDGSCKDATRLCFVSYDPDLWTAPGKVQPLPPAEPAPICLNTAFCKPTSLHDCVSTSLHNNAEIVLRNIAAKVDGLKALGSKHPKLVKLYTEFIEPRYQAVQGGRNDFIVQAVPFLYRAVAAPYVLELVGTFYDCNRSLFKDTRDDHMKEATAMLESVIKGYPEDLSANERKIYEALSEQERGAFRICRDLALLPGQPEQKTFFLAFGHLADRLGIYGPQAQRIMRQLAIYGLIDLREKGTRRAAKVQGKAGVYKWLL